MTVVRFEPGLKPVLKHGQHDQKDHGRRGGAITPRPVDADQIAAQFAGPVRGNGVEVTATVTFTGLQPVVRGGPGVPLAGGELVDAHGRVVGEWARGVDGTTLHAVFLTVGTDVGGKPYPGGADVAGKGLALEFQKRTEDAARALGCDTIRVHAVDQGAAAWANERFGYRFATRPDLRTDSSPGREPRDDRERAIPLGGMGYPNGSREYRGEDGLMYGFRHPDLGVPAVRARLADIERRLASSDPDDWPSPHEVATVGTGRRVDDDIIRGATLGEWLLSRGWEGVKPSTHVTKAASAVFRLIVDPAVEPVAKHGSHDQSTHGRRGGTAVLDHPAVDRLRAGEPVIVKPDAVADVVLAFRDSTDGPVDLTNLHVEGHGLFGSEGLGIPREDMPQIPKAHRDKFFEEMRAKGVTITEEQVSALSLHPTQREMDAVNVAGMVHSMREGTFSHDTHTLIASSDGYILDGHHRWAASAITGLDGGNGSMRVARIGLPIRDLLEQAQAFNEREGIESRGLGDHRRRVYKALCDIAEARAVAKHGNHDQSTHGRRFSTSVDPAVARAAIESTREHGGLSIRLTDGYLPEAGFMVGRDSTRFGIAVSAESFYGPDGARAIADMVKKNRAALGSGRAYLGVWHQKSKWVGEGKDAVEVPLPWEEQVVHLDVSDNIPNRGRAVSLGRRRDQISVWDVVAMEEIQTGGKGGEVVKGTRGVRDPEAPSGDDGRGDRPLGRGRPRGDGRPAVVRFGAGLRPVLKHGDPSRPGYAQQHPDSKATATSMPDGWAPRSREQRIAEVVERARADFGGAIPEDRLQAFGEASTEGTVVYDGPNGTTLTARSDIPEAALIPQMRQVSHLQSIAPVPGLEVVVSDSTFDAYNLPESTLGFVGSGMPNTIHLRRRAVMEGANTRSGRLMPVYTTDAHLYVVTHEYGHVLDRRSKRQSADDHAEAISSHQTGMSRYGFDGDPVDGESGREAFAEAFVGFVGSRGQLAASDGQGGKAFVRFYAERYGWDHGDGERPLAAGFAKADGPRGLTVILADTFTEEGAIVRRATVVRFEPGLKPVLKHGDPSRPGYAELHPNGRHGSGSHELGDAMERRIEMFAKYGPQLDGLQEIIDEFDATPTENDLRERAEAYYDEEIERRARADAWDAVTSDPELYEGRDDDELRDRVEEMWEDYREGAVASVVDDYRDTLIEGIQRDRVYFDGDDALARKGLDVEAFDEVFGVRVDAEIEGVPVILSTTVASVTFSHENDGGAGEDGHSGLQIQGVVQMETPDGDIVDIGEFQRSFTIGPDGRPEVSHDLLRIWEESHRGLGLAKAMNGQAEAYYISQGIAGVKVHAALENGGYAWARQGFDFRSPGTVPYRLDQYLARNKGSLPPKVVSDMEDIAVRFGLPRSDPDYPTPMEVAMVGRVAGAPTHPGKEIMSGSDWYGYKPLRPQDRRITRAQQEEAYRTYWEDYARELTQAQVPGQLSLESRIRDAEYPGGTKPLIPRDE